MIAGVERAQDGAVARQVLRVVVGVGGVALGQCVGDELGVAHGVGDVGPEVRVGLPVFLREGEVEGLLVLA